MTHDETTARALVGGWLNEGWVEEDEAPFIAQDITAVLAASRAEGKGWVAALRDALETCRCPEVDVDSMHSPVDERPDSPWCSDPQYADPEGCTACLVRRALDDTAAAAQAHDAAVERRGAQKERERCDRVLEMHEEAERRWEQKHGDEQRGAIGQRPTDCVQYALRQARLAIRALRDDGP